jgi:hypothetical protein
MVSPQANPVYFHLYKWKVGKPINYKKLEQKCASTHFAGLPISSTRIKKECNVIRSND